MFAPASYYSELTQVPSDIIFFADDPQTNLKLEEHTKPQQSSERIVAYPIKLVPPNLPTAAKTVNFTKFFERLLQPDIRLLALQDVLAELPSLELAESVRRYTDSSRNAEALGGAQRKNYSEDLTLFQEYILQWEAAHPDGEADGEEGGEYDELDEYDDEACTYQAWMRVNERKLRFLNDHIRMIEIDMRRDISPEDYAYLRDSLDEHTELKHILREKAERLRAEEYRYHFPSNYADNEYETGLCQDPFTSSGVPEPPAAHSQASQVAGGSDPRRPFETAMPPKWDGTERRQITISKILTTKTNRKKKKLLAKSVRISIEILP
jgi:hypothetical protein